VGSGDGLAGGIGGDGVWGGGEVGGLGVEGVIFFVKSPAEPGCLFN